MAFSVREGSFDVIIAAGPRLQTWPSPGVRTISSICAKAGLTVGIYGGEDVFVRGVIPQPGSGASVIVEDQQERIHRMSARAVVRFASPSELPDPFPGWRSQGLIPLSTAKRLDLESEVSWAPSTVILGTGNPALRFGSSLLERGVSEVFCVELHPQWGAKRSSGWEVERRRFEVQGGKMIEGTPLSLTRKAPLVWHFRLQDSQGVRLIETARVVSAGPFGELPGVREYPPASFLFEIDQTAGPLPAENIEGWNLEEDRSKWLASRIVRFLATDVSSFRDEVDRTYRQARNRIRLFARHREEPFTPTYQGKWMSAGDLKKVHAFSGTPALLHQKKATASIECFEDISCNLCEQACPEGAISFARKRENVLNEDRCTACAKCLVACPSAATLLIQEDPSGGSSALTFPWRGEDRWQVGELATLVNRRGDALGSARVAHVENGPQQLVRVDVPPHLVWEARGLKRVKPLSEKSENFVHEINKPVAESRINVTMDGEARLVRDKISVSVALFETGQGRAEDILLCPDGSCGLCQITVDGVKKLACQTEIHPRINIRKPQEETSVPAESPPEYLCPCVKVTRDTIVERIVQGKLRSPEAVISSTHVGQGKCHGQLCTHSFRRLLTELGLQAEQWIDWRFPSSDWKLSLGLRPVRPQVGRGTSKE